MADILKMLGSAILGAIIALYLPFLRQLIWGPKLKLFFGKEIEGSIAKTPIERNLGLKIFRLRQEQKDIILE